MTVCLEGGLSLQETIRRVSDELRIVHPALAGELSIVQRDIEIGATVDQALKRFATRSDYEGVRTLSTFIREAQRFGTNITEALRSHADLLRSQRTGGRRECPKGSGKDFVAHAAVDISGRFCRRSWPGVNPDPTGVRKVN